MGRRKRVLGLLSRSLSCIAALYILYSEYSVSIGNKEVLRGTTSSPILSNKYSSANVPQLLVALATHPDEVELQLQDLFSNSTDLQVAYLDSNDEVESNDISLTSECSQNTDADYIYEATYLEQLLHHALFQEPSWNASNYWVFVDCSFDGRVLNDTTCAKVYLVDKDMSPFSTVFVQTLSIIRPEKFLHTSGGLSMFVSTPLNSIFPSSDGKYVSSSQPASYKVSIGFSFPFDWNPFLKVHMEEEEPPPGQTWRGQVESTRERILFGGTSEIYRRGPDVQGSYDKYYWQMPSDPIEFASSTQYIDMNVAKDSGDGLAASWVSASAPTLLST
ncbi:hypothetical protein LEN26_010931 [Aphanomyces euteiches]|nr:hypothetical protein LEN26_010931 [Aphanomyces euteiches]